MPPEPAAPRLWSEMPDSGQDEASARILEFRSKPRSHVLVKRRDASGRLVFEDDIAIPEIVFYAAR